MDSTFYVYYRLDAAQVAAARRSLMGLFADLRATTGISGRLARRQDDPATWMEVYEHVADSQAFRRLLEAKAAEYGMDHLVAAGSSRKTEIFEPDRLEPDAGTACA